MKRNNNNNNNTINDTIKYKNKKQTINHINNKSNDILWNCFICNNSITNNIDFINIHIDSCINKQKPKINYNISNEQVIEIDIDDNEENLTLLLSKSFHIKDNNIIISNQIPGLILIHNFLSLTEDDVLFNEISKDNNPWKLSSFSGHCDCKMYGVRTQFGLPNEERLVRNNNVSKGEYDLPKYTNDIMYRFKQLLKQYPLLFPKCVQSFQPNECNSNLYIKSRNDYLKSHYDDRFLSGEVIMNLSLIGDCLMTYTDSNNRLNYYDIHLPRGTLQLLTGNARYYYEHAIKNENILNDRRVSITWRQAGDNKRGVIGSNKYDLNYFWKK